MTWKTKSLFIPEWDASVLIRQINGLERLRFEDLYGRVPDIRSRLVLMCLSDGTGSRLFQDYELDLIDHLSQPVLDLLYAECVVFNCLSKGAQEGLERAFLDNPLEQLIYSKALDMGILNVERELEGMTSTQMSKWQLVDQHMHSSQWVQHGQFMAAYSQVNGNKNAKPSHFQPQKKTVPQSAEEMKAEFAAKRAFDKAKGKTNG